MSSLVSAGSASQLDVRPALEEVEPEVECGQARLVEEIAGAGEPERAGRGIMHRSPPQCVVQTAYGPRSSSILPRATATSCASDRNSRGRYMAACSVEPSRYLSLTGPLAVERLPRHALRLRGEVDDGQLAAVVDPAGAGREPARSVQSGRDDPPAGALPGVAEHVIGGEHRARRARPRRHPPQRASDRAARAARSR